MIWGVFLGQELLDYFLRLGTTMNSLRYEQLLQEKLQIYLAIHWCSILCMMHHAKSVKNHLQKNNVETLNWPGTSPDVNPIKNFGKYSKTRLRENSPKCWNVESSY